MNRRIETRVFHPAGAATGYLVERNPVEVYWLTACPNVFLTAGEINIYDGFDAGGVLKWDSHPGQSRHYNFIPPIHCEQGLFVDCDANMGCLTIAWRPKKWDRPKPPEADEIKHPEA